MLKIRFLLVGVLIAFIVGLTVSSARKSGETLKSISVGGGHTCGLSSSGTAFCWGDNKLNTLGNNGEKNSSIPVPIATPYSENPLIFSSLSAGNWHSCGLTLEGRGYCWGNNLNGENGNGTTDSLNVPVAVTSDSDGTSLIFSKISASNSILGFACGVNLNGTAYCWGYNEGGQLGNGTLKNSSIPVVVVAPKNGVSLSFSTVTTGGFHACGLTLSGNAYCWGANERGELGNYSTKDSSIPVAVVAPKGGKTLIFSSISVGVSHACGLVANGEAYCWGSNGYGALGNNGKTNSSAPVAVLAPKNGKRLAFLSISAGYLRTCGLTLKGKAYCWGSSYLGAMGTKNPKDSRIPIAVSAPGSSEPLAFSSISTGTYHTCGLTTRGKAYCWGNNEHGELGNNTTTNSSIPVAVSPLP